MDNYGNYSRCSNLLKFYCNHKRYEILDNDWNQIEIYHQTKVTRNVTFREKVQIIGGKEMKNYPTTVC